MKIICILGFLILHFAENKITQGADYVASGVFSVSDMLLWTLDNDWYYCMSKCRLSFPGVIFHIQEAYLFFYMNTAFKDYKDWTSGIVLQSSDQCVLVHVQTSLAFSFDYEHQFQYKPNGIQLAGGCYIFGSEASAINFASSFGCGIGQMSSTSAEISTTLSTTTTSTSPSTTSLATTFTASSTTTKSPSITSTATTTNYPFSTSTTTAIATGNSTPTITNSHPVPSITTTTYSLSTTSSVTAIDSTPTTTKSPKASTTTIITFLQTASATFAGSLKEVAEMKNVFVSSTPLFAQRIGSILHCGRLCLREPSCLSVFFDHSGNNVDCFGHSTIFKDGQVANTSYFIVLE